MAREGIVIFLVFFLALFLLGCSSSVQEVCFGSDCFEVEIADSFSERAQGLMDRGHLDGGMLFMFDESGNYPFWMKNTLISLDMIWLDAEKKVVALHTHVQPCEEDPCPPYDPESDALYVIELNAGVVDSLDISVGDVVFFR